MSNKESTINFLDGRAMPCTSIILISIISDIPPDNKPASRQRRRYHKNARVKVPFCNITGNKVTLFRQSGVPGRYKVGRSLVASEKAPITKKKSASGVTKRLVSGSFAAADDDDDDEARTTSRCVGGWSRLVAANIKPCHLRVWRTTVIHNIVRPHYLRLASLRACLVVRASPPFLLLTSCPYIGEVTRDEKERVGERFLIDWTRHFVIQEISNFLVSDVVYLYVEQYRMTPARRWLLSERNLKPVLCEHWWQSRLPVVS